MAKESEVRSRRSYRMTAGLFNIEFAFMGGLRTSGTESLPEEGPYIVVPSHQSIYDIPAVALTMLRSRETSSFYIAKKELNKPVLGSVFKGWGAIFIDRSASTLPEKAQAGIERTIDSGGVLTVFAEGTRSKDGKVGKLHRTVGALAHKYGLPLVPVGIAGTLKDSGVRGRGPIHVHTAAPLHVEQFEIDLNDPRQLSLAGPATRDLTIALREAQAIAASERNSLLAENATSRLKK